jgi:hypothetical protein
VCGRSAPVMSLVILVAITDIASKGRDPRCGPGAHDRQQEMLAGQSMAGPLMVPSIRDPMETSDIVSDY